MIKPNHILSLLHTFQPSLDYPLYSSPWRIHSLCTSPLVCTPFSLRSSGGPRQVFEMVIVCTRILDAGLSATNLMTGGVPFPMIGTTNPKHNSGRTPCTTNEIRYGISQSQYFNIPCSSRNAKYYKSSHLKTVSRIDLHAGFALQNRPAACAWTYVQM